MTTALQTQIATATQRLVKLSRRAAIHDYTAKQRERKNAHKTDSLARRADAHKKIALGGLVIAAGADDWNPAEIVGVLLAWLSLRTEKTDHREKITQLGVERLSARATTRIRKC